MRLNSHIARCEDNLGLMNSIIKIPNDKSITIKHNLNDNIVLFNPISGEMNRRVGYIETSLGTAVCQLAECNEITFVINITLS